MIAACVAAVLIAVVVAVSLLVAQRNSGQQRLARQRMEIEADQSKSLDQIRLAEIERESLPDRRRIRELDVEHQKLTNERWAK